MCMVSSIMPHVQPFFSLAWVFSFQWSGAGCVGCFSVVAKHSSALSRLRPDNTYLLLDDFGENGVEDTGLTTELGVMSNEEEEHRDQQVCLTSPACLLHKCL